MNRRLFDFSIGPVKLHVHKPDAYSWKPERWWSPQVTHLRPLPGVVINIPRRWWPGKRDGYRTCIFCGQRRWLEAPPICACEQCRRTLACMTTNMKGPPWWPDRLARAYEAATGEKWTK